MLRQILTVFCAIFAYGCATAPLIPEGYSGPKAAIVDTAKGGGMAGGTFFVLEEVDGVSVNNSLDASRAASFGRGTDLQIRGAEREVMAGARKLKLAGRVAYAAPIQEMFSRRTYSVERVVEADLKPNTRYRVTGNLDAFRQEVWLQEDGSSEPVGQVIASTPVAGAPESQAGFLFTCCNLHYEDDWISDANWAGLPFIPAGARIRIDDYGRHRASAMIEGRPMRIGHDFGREQESREQFVEKLTVKDDPRLQIATYPANVQAAIRAGKVMPGMTREQVLISVGYPRTDTTPSLESSRWVYWTYSEEEAYVVVWGGDGRVREIDAPRHLQGLVLFDE